MSSKSITCEKCKGKVLPITYGLPLEEDYNNPDFISGGCVIMEDSPTHQCVDCGSQFTKDRSTKNLKLVFEGFNDFDDEWDKMEAEHTKAANELKQKYKKQGLDFKSYGGVVPFQAEGYINNKFFYFRFRSDTARLMVGDFVEGEYLPVNAVTFAIEDATGEPFNGFLGYEEFLDLFSKLVDQYLATIR
jgi:hypothetical protein